MDPAIIAKLVQVFPALNATLLVSLIALFLKNRLESRKLTIGENAGLRKEFIEEMAVLRGELHSARDELRSARDESGSLRDEVRNLRAEVRNRDDQIIALRGEVRELHGVIDGLRRETQTGSIAAQRVIARGITDVSPEMQDALDKLDAMVPTLPGERVQL